MALVQSELSEPYVIYTFRYFLHQWPELAFLAYPSGSSDPVGVIVCKQSMHRHQANRGYIAMLSVSKDWRKRGIGISFVLGHGMNLTARCRIASTLVRNAMEAMKENNVEEIVLETEFDNHAALSLYESLGFIREKRLYRFYLNGKDAFRLVLEMPSDDDSEGDKRMLRYRPSYRGPASAYSDSDDDDESSR
ncbi:hypothetical protein HWV62_38198 [Athelia sp. TMB]|nr:hypothetical protein HWV62_38198 [Athelia sp. TMB]